VKRERGEEESKRWNNSLERLETAQFVVGKGSMPLLGSEHIGDSKHYFIRVKKHRNIYVYIYI
jgi:hypothetical protein